MMNDCLPHAWTVKSCLDICVKQGKTLKVCFTCKENKPISDYDKKSTITTINICKNCIEKEKENDKKAQESVKLEKEIIQKISKIHSDARESCKKHNKKYRDNQKQFLLTKQELKDVFEEQNRMCKNTNIPLIVNGTIKMSFQCKNSNLDYTKENSKFIYYDTN